MLTEYQLYKTAGSLLCLKFAVIIHSSHQYRLTIYSKKRKLLHQKRTLIRSPKFTISIYCLVIRLSRETSPITQTTWNGRNIRQCLMYLAVVVSVSALLETIPDFVQGFLRLLESWMTSCPSSRLADFLNFQGAINYYRWLVKAITYIIYSR